MNRREFLKSSLVLGAGTLLPTSIVQAALGHDDKDHFLILYLIGGGVDSSYWFDPRSRALTEANLKTNFMVGGDDQILRPIQDIGGGRHFCSPLVESLWKDHGDYLSVLKGVYMSSAFDGHDNNMTMLLTGKALASDSFVPEVSAGSLLDFVQSGLALDFAQNLGGGANLSPAMMTNLVQRLRGSSFQDKPGDAFIRERFQKVKATGLLGHGSQKVSDGLNRRAELGEILSRFKIEEYVGAAGSTLHTQFLPVLRDAFVNRLTKVALFRDGGINAIDSHAVVQCEMLAKASYPPIIDNISKLLKYLKATPFDKTRKLSDVCTVVVTSEFNRTYRTMGFDDVTRSGTDHNQFSNFVLIGGKGIKPGRICGDTDLKEVDGAKQFTQVSKAHRERDPNLIKAMGLPFDFDRLNAKPFPVDGSFQLDQHLTYNSVINTILHLFGVNRSAVMIEGTATRAPIIRGLLT